VDSISSREVNAELRSLVWPELCERGFIERTQRTAWRDHPHSVAVVNFQSFNSYLAQMLDATTFSFAVNLGVRARASSAHREEIKVKNGKLRPGEHQCNVRLVLQRSLDQPELARRDIWYVRPNGSNLTEAVEDARSVLMTIGMAWLDEFSNPERMLQFAENEPDGWGPGKKLQVGTFGLGNMGSPARLRLIDDLRRTVPQ